MPTAATALEMTKGNNVSEPEDQVRAHTYGLLGALLANAPSQDLLEMLAQVDLAPAEVGDFADAWRQLAIAAKMAAGADNGANLAQEYQDLFIGVGRGEVVPYGSWYLTGFLMDKPLALLRADLQRLGFERQEEVKEPEDHAAALCETMAMLLAEGHDQNTQRAFFETHMAPWMKSFYRDLSEAKSAAFYRAVGQFGEQFVEFESGYLRMLV